MADLFERDEDMSVFGGYDDTISASIQAPAGGDRQCLAITAHDLQQLPNDGEMDPSMYHLLESKLAGSKSACSVEEKLLQYLQMYWSFNPKKRSLQSLKEVFQSDPVTDAASLQDCIQKRMICPRLPCLFEPECKVQVINKVYQLPTEPSCYQAAIDSLRQDGHVFPLLWASCVKIRENESSDRNDDGCTHFQIGQLDALYDNTFKIRLATVGNPEIGADIRALLQTNIHVPAGKTLSTAEQILVLAHYMSWKQCADSERPNDSLTDSSTDSQDEATKIGVPLNSRAEPRASKAREYFQFEKDGSVRLLLPSDTRGLLGEALRLGQVTAQDPSPPPFDLENLAKPAILRVCVVAAIVPGTKQGSGDLAAPASVSSGGGSQRPGLRTDGYVLDADHKYPKKTTVPACSHATKHGASGSGSFCDNCLRNTRVSKASKREVSGSGASSWCDSCLRKTASKFSMQDCQHGVLAQSISLSRSVSVPVCERCKRAITASFTGSWCRKCKHEVATQGSVTVSFCPACKDALQAAATVASVSDVVCQNAAVVTTQGSVSVCIACRKAMPHSQGSGSVRSNYQQAAPQKSVTVSFCPACKECDSAAANVASGSDVVCQNAGAVTTQGSFSVSLCIACRKAMPASDSVRSNYQQAAPQKSVTVSFCPACKERDSAAASVASGSDVKDQKAMPHSQGSFSVSLCSVCKNAGVVTTPGSVSVSLCSVCKNAGVVTTQGSFSVSVCSVCQNAEVVTTQESMSDGLCKACADNMAATPGSLSVSVCIECQKAATTVASGSDVVCQNAGVVTTQGSFSVSLCIACRKAMPASGSVRSNYQQAAPQKSVTVSFCPACKERDSAAASVASGSDVKDQKAMPHSPGSFSVSVCSVCKNAGVVTTPGSVSVSVCSVCKNAGVVTTQGSVSDVGCKNAGVVTTQGSVSVSVCIECQKAATQRSVSDRLCKGSVTVSKDNRAVTATDYQQAHTNAHEQYTNSATTSARDRASSDAVESSNPRKDDPITPVCLSSFSLSMPSGSVQPKMVAEPGACFGSFSVPGPENFSDPVIRSSAGFPCSPLLPKKNDWITNPVYCHDSFSVRLPAGEKDSLNKATDKPPQSGGEIKCGHPVF